MTNETDKLENARKQGQAQFDSIREMVAALECNYDRLQELRAQQGAETLGDEEREELAELIEAAGECKDVDEARERIEEDALSVAVRSDWRSPYGEDSKPSQFRILLCTGGPAVQIRGELNDYLEPYRAWLEVQDWFTPWTEFWPEGAGDIQETLLSYARCFYFGE